MTSSSKTASTSSKFLLSHSLDLARLHRPLPILLLFLPCLWGVALCTPSIFLSKNIVASQNIFAIITELKDALYKNALFLLHWGGIFAIGSLCMRSAGCIFNDMCDVAFDAKVERTKQRPLAAGYVSRLQAIALLILFLGGGFSIWLYLSNFAKIVSLAALGLLFLYPYTKRFFIFPQLILGFAFNSGIIIAVAELNPDLLLTSQPWLLYGVGIFWTLYYDTIYAAQDLKDDLLIGIHSTAVYFKNSLKKALGSFYIVMNIFMAILGYTLHADLWFYVALIFGIIYDVGVKLRSTRLDNPKDAQSLFHQAILIGLGIFVLILMPNDDNIPLKALTELSNFRS